MVCKQEIKLHLHLIIFRTVLVSTKELFAMKNQVEKKASGQLSTCLMQNHNKNKCWEIVHINFHATKCEKKVLFYALIIFTHLCCAKTNCAKLT